MGQRIVTTLIDDLDGTELDPGTGETIRFGIDGRSYEIDLRDENAETLRSALRPFIEAGRKVVIPRASKRRRT